MNLNTDHTAVGACSLFGFSESSIDQGGGKRRGISVAPSQAGRLRFLAPYLYDFGNKGILWRPSVHGAAMGTLGKFNPVGQLIDICQIDIDVRGDQSVRVRASEHQLCQWSLHQSPGEEGRSLCDSGADRRGILPEPAFYDRPRRDTGSNHCDDRHCGH
jgi:hypothetical protein